MSSYDPPGSDLPGVAPTAAQPIVPQAFVPAGSSGAAPQPDPDKTPSTTRTVALTLVGTVLVIGLGVGAFLIGRSGSDTSATSTTEAPTTSVETTTTAPTTTPTTVAPPPETAAPVEAAAPAEPAPEPVGDVRGAPAGLLCRDLKARGYSYSAAVDYWRVHGQPDRMDADRNGIPCETVYSRADIVAYWPAATYQATPWYGLPSGLLCRDLKARGIDVYGALSYFIADGYPSRMDADGNGIPCETVYSDAALIWTRGY